MSVNNKSLLIGVYCLISAPIFSQNVYLELNLNNRAIQNQLRASRSRPSLELFRAIEKAANDKRIRGIILNVSGFDADQEYLWEIRNALQEFKSKGKKICAFISSADLDTYCLASVADKIVMDEQGSLNLLGYAWGRAYTKNALEKLGVGVRELRYMEYKSAVETFTRNSMSDADRRQYGEYLNDVFAVTKETVLKARSISSEEFDSLLNNDFLYSPKNALQRGLVDKVGREKAVAETLEEMEGAEVNSLYIFGDVDSSLMDSKFQYKAGTAGGLFNKPPVIAIVYANGQTDMEQGMAARVIARTIREVSKKRRVKAIVLRINSPGGSAEAADYVAEAVKQAKERVPVVVSMGQVAASGGYWAAMYASKIVASPHTLTGSIGVIGSWFYDKGLNNKLGLSVDTLKMGDHADLMTGVILPHRDLTNAEEERYRRFILDMYGDFTAKVAVGRNMELEKVEALAQGRIYSGTSALNAGLIDSIGGLADAVRIARDLAGIPEGSKVQYNEFPKPTFWEKMLTRLPATSVFGAGGVAKAAASARGSASARLPSSLLDVIIPAPLLEDLLYRISHNGQVMPILPMEAGGMP
jgi:protease-4